MTTRSARRAAVVEVRPDAISASLAGVPGAFSRPASNRRAERDAAACTLELNAAERAMLLEALAPLTEREREVVFAVCAGGQNPAIAERLYIALPTLRTHLMRINQKLGLRSKSETIRFVLATLLEQYRRQSVGAARPSGGHANCVHVGASEFHDASGHGGPA